MHKFSELVKFRNDLAASVKHLQLKSAVEEKISELTKLKKLNPGFVYNEQIDEYIHEFAQLIHLNKQIIEKIQRQIDSIDLEIDQLAKMLFDTEHQRQAFTLDLLPAENPKFNQDTDDYIITRIGSYCNWKYPGAVVYPREQKWVLAMVANDPLYIVEHNHVELADLIEGFNEVYVNRLRCYTNGFISLPKQQFSFVLLWNVLNYISVDRFEYYIKQAYELLRPGGTFMFSYNNTDIEQSAVLAELDINSYANARIIKTLAKKIGFEIFKFEDLPTGDSMLAYASWVELRKPGELTTIKAHQALAQILGK